MAIFLAQSQQSHELDPLQWWKANELRPQSLSLAACKCLAIPATSTLSERGIICNRRRASLSPGNIDALVFLNVNAEVLCRALDS